MEPPIDHGWAWMCALGSAINLFFVVGGLRSVGILFVEIVNRFEATRALTAVTVCLIAAGFAVLSPIANGLGMKFSNRKVVIVGGCVTALAVFLAAFANSIYYIIVIFGGLTGVGYGIIFGPCMVVVGQFFNKRRSLANGLAAAGGSLGQLCIPMLITKMLDKYGFQGTMMIYSALILHCIPGAMLMRPFTFWTGGKPFNPQAAAAAKAAAEEAAALDANSNHPKEAANGTDTADSELLTPGLRAPDSTHMHFSNDDLRPRALTASSLNPLSNSKLSVYASHHSLAFQAHQDPPEEAKDELDEVPAGPEPPAKKPGCCAMFDWSLFKNWLFVIYVGGLSCGHGGYINVCMFLPAFAVENGVEKDMVAILLGVVGMADLVGRVLGGWFADLGLMKRNNIMFMCLCFTGICANILPFTPNFPSFIVFAIVLGMIGGVYVSLMVVVIVDFLGLQNLAKAFGLATMCMGLATIPIPIVLGILKDSLGSFGPSIHICGTLMFFGGVFFGLEPCARRLNARKDKFEPANILKCDRETNI